MLSSRRGGAAGVAYTGKGVARRRRRRVAGGGGSLPRWVGRGIPAAGGARARRVACHWQKRGPGVANPDSGSAPPIGLLPPNTRVLDQRADPVVPPCWFSGGRSAGPQGETVYFVQQILFDAYLK